MWFQEDHLHSSKIENILWIRRESLLSTACPRVNNRVSGPDWEDMTSNSWHSEADPSRQCCCGIAGVTACPAPGCCPARSWQMVLKLLVCIEGGRLQVRRGGRAKQRALVCVCWAKGLRWTGLQRGHTTPQADRCFSSSGLTTLAWHPSLNKWIIHFCNVCVPH